MGNDPVANFLNAQKQSTDFEEQKIRKRLAKRPLIATLLNFHCPGGGFFYLGKPAMGCLHMLVFFILFLLLLIGIVRVFESALLIVFLIILSGVLLEGISAIHARFVALAMHQKAEEDWEKYQQYKQQLQETR